jgi:hypothetical protein
MDEGIKKDVWSLMDKLMEDFFKAPGGMDFSKMLLITLCVHHRFDGEVKEGAHGAFPTQETMKLPQTTWIETFLEGITDKVPDCPSSRSLPGLCTRSLVSCAQRLFVSTAGLSRGGFTLKRAIDSVRNWLRGSFALTQTLY